MVTHPAHRKKGYSQKILNHIETQARNEKCDLLILWSDLFSFYEKLGYSILGDCFEIEPIGPHYVMQKNIHS